MKLKSTAMIMAIAATITITITITPANAGGMSGMATEPTQLMNNVELLFQSAQEAENLLVTINQYTTMLQNLQQLPSQMVSQVLGENFGSVIDKINKFQQLASVVQRVQNSSMNMGNALKTAAGAADRLNMTPAQFAQMAVEQARSRNAYFQEQVKLASNAAESVQRDSKALQKVADEIGSGGAGDAGIVRAVGNLTQSSIINAQIASEIKAGIAQLSQMQAVKSQADEQDKELIQKRLEIERQQLLKAFKIN